MELKKLDTINVMQRSTATGMDQSATMTLYVAESVIRPGVMAVLPAQWLDAVKWRAVACVVVNHPWIMWGPWEDTTRDICLAVTRDLIAKGWLTVNDWGTVFGTDRLTGVCHG